MAPLQTKKPLTWGAIIVLLVLAWQTLTVHFNYQGNWTALFCTGALKAVPPQLAFEHIYTFPASNGFDGQFYHYIAHDPFLLRGIGLGYVDTPRLRYERILVPFLAYALSGPNWFYTDRAYRCVELVFFFLGAFWTAQFALLHGRTSAWALSFLFIPGCLVTLDRMTIDAALVALTAGFALYTRPHRNAVFLYVILVLAALTRETGALLTAGYCGWLLWHRHIRQAVLFATAVLPMLGWYFYVNSRTPPIPANIPLGYLASFHMLEQYSFGPLLSSLIHSLDILALLGVPAVLVIAVLYLLRDATMLPAVLLVAPALVIGLLPYDAGRVLSPALLLEVFLFLRTGSHLGLAPAVMMTPRSLAQFGFQAVGVLRALLH